MRWLPFALVVVLVAACGGTTTEHPGQSVASSSAATSSEFLPAASSESLTAVTPDSSGTASTTSTTDTTSTADTKGTGASLEDAGPPDARGCVPPPCSQLGADCGEVTDPKCGALIQCGKCPAGETCGGEGVPHQCAKP